MILFPYHTQYQPSTNEIPPGIILLYRVDTVVILNNMVFFFSRMFFLGYNVRLRFNVKEAKCI